MREETMRFVSGHARIVIAIGIVAAAVTSIVMSVAYGAQSSGAPVAWKSVSVSVKPVELGVERVGALRFRGGLELDCGDPAFGGISGLEVRPDNSFLAVTDMGTWIAGRLELDAASGALRGVTNVWIAPMLDERGAPLRSKDESDAEGLTLLGGGRVAVSFERTQIIRVYRLGADANAGANLPGIAEHGPLLDGVRDLSPNLGLEALATFGDGDRLVVGSEQGDSRGARIWTTTTDATAPAPPVAHLSLADGYGFVGLDQLPDGDFIALERAYSPELGVRIRVLRIAANSIREGGDIHADSLAELARPLELDNFESVSAVTLSSGTRIYVIADDNFSPAQRTLLYAFDLEKP